MQKYILAVILAIIITTACRKQAEKPNILNDKQLVNMIIDIHMADANMSENNIYRSGNNYRPSYYYNYIYTKYNLNNKQFDSIINYYSQNLKDFEYIYEQVIDSLNKQETQLTLLLKKEKQDTVNLFKRQIRIPDSNLQSKTDSLNFIVPTYKTKGLFTIKAKYKLFHDDSSEKTKMIAYFAKNKQDSLKFKIFFDSITYKRSNKFINLNAQLELIDSSYTRLFVNFYKTSSKKGEYNKNFKIKDVIIYNTKITDSIGGKLIFQESNYIRDIEKNIIPNR